MIEVNLRNLLEKFKFGKVTVFVFCLVFLLCVVRVPCVNAGSSDGELYMWIGFVMAPGDSNAKRIASARDTYGVPIWLDSGNWGIEQLNSAYIKYFHSHGVKVICRLWSDYGDNPLSNILHRMDVGSGSRFDRGSVDYQLSIGPEIDGFMIDECNQNDYSYYKAIADYVHARGKLLFVNPGGHNLQARTFDYADKVSVEFAWYALSTVTDFAKRYPGRIIGQSNDYGYSSGAAPYMPPKSAGGDRPAYSNPLSLKRAVWDTQFGWDDGVLLESRPGDTNGNAGSASALPSWWGDYVKALASGSVPQPTQITLAAASITTITIIAIGIIIYFKKIKKN